MTKQFKPGIWIILIITFVISSCADYSKTSENLTKLDNYNVIWDSPSKDQNGSMPIGNGDIGLNVWVEESGDICFYIGKTDTWGDNGRLLKVGKVRVKCEPAIIFPGAKFAQELDLKTGSILISSVGEHKGNATKFNLRVWVDANNPVIHVNNESSLPVEMSANIEMWRTEPFSLTSIGVGDLLEDRSLRPSNLHAPVVVEPDNIITDSKDYIGWYHYNKKSVGFDLTNKLQGVSEFFKTDPILHRTFGAIITGTNTERINNKKLVAATSKKSHFSIYILTEHPSNPGQWQSNIEKLEEKIEEISFSERLDNHLLWWSKFWERSWMYATESNKELNDENSDAFIVTRGYILQRFIDASSGRGKFPIKFNGSIFTVEPDTAKMTNKQKFGSSGGPDYRRWGPGYWWQNTRLPYLSMCAAGDFDLMQPFFKMYTEDIYELSKFRTQKYFGIEGVYYPECVYFWGSVFTGDYGWTPYEERKDPLQDSKWHKWEWVGGLEFAFMMLDYYDYTLEKEFLKNKIIPITNDFIKFFDNYYKTNDDGKLVMYPSMAAETWWDCTNPTTELSGLYALTKRLLALPENLSTESDRKFWKSIKAKLPEIPLRDTPSGKALAPAERFESKNNSENPELYPVFPFRLFGVGLPNIEWGINALEHRVDSGHHGWRQDDIFMSYLGLTDQAKKNLVARSKEYDKNSRFPAFWGPNYDWTPDQDHGGVQMKTFQSMLMQVDPYSKKIFLLPAWPKEWNAEFKLHAPYNTTIEGRVQNGEIKDLKVSPSSRKDDIIIKECSN